MSEPIICRTVTERVTIDLDQDALELAIAYWLMDRHADAFRGVTFKFDWQDYPSPGLTVSGERVTS